MSDAVHSVGIVALHPIQYQVGLWRTLARHPRLVPHVYYLDDVGIDGSIDPTLNAPMKWDVPMLGGYEHEFVPNLSPFRYTWVVHRVNPALYRRIVRRHFDALVIHGYLTISNWFALAAAKRSGALVVYRGEGSARARDKFEGPLVDAVKNPLNAWFLRRCDAIAYSSLDNRQYHLERGAPEERLFSMPCAVDNEQLELLAERAAPASQVRARHATPAGCRVVVCVGRFAEHKRMTDVVAAFATDALRGREDVRLWMIGDGPLRPAVEAQARESGIADRVRFLGFLNQPEMVEAVLAADLFALASSHGDPSPKALGEALYLGKPAVVSDGVGTCEDVIEAGRNGLIYPRGEPAALARSLVALLDRPERLPAMGEASHAVAKRDDFQAGVDSLVARLDALRAASRASSGARETGEERA